MAAGFPFLEGGGRARALIEARDWSAHPLGPPEAWPDGLKTALSLVVNSPESMILCWGPKLWCFFNETYIPLLGPRVETAMGEPLLTVWADAAEQALPIIEDAMAGRSRRFDDLPWKLSTDRGEADTWWTFSYSRILGPDGAPAGLFIFTNETTQKVLADRRLAEVVQRQHRSLQQMPGFVAILDGPEHRFSYANDAYAEIAGARPLIDRTVREAFPEIADQGFYELLDGVFTSGEPFAALAIPIRLDREDGNRFVDLTYEPVRGDDGEVSGIFVGGYDVTDRVRAEKRREALLKLDDRLRDIADPAELAYASAEVLGEALGACRVGYGDMDSSAGAITVGGTWSLPGLPDTAGRHDFADYGTYIDELRLGRAVTIADIETDPRTADKAASFRALGIRACLDAPVMEEGRTVAEVFVHSPFPRAWTADDIALACDVAERTRAAMARRAAETALGEREARYRTLFETIDEGFCIVEFIDGPRGPLSDYVHLEANPAYERHAGLCDIVGKTGRSQLSEAEAEEWVRLFRQVLDTGEPVRFERKLEVTGRHLEVACFRVEPATRRQLAILFQDVSQRKRAELGLRELAETLEQRVNERTAERDRMWENSPDLMLVLDDRRLIRRVNPAWTTVLGYAPEELLGRHVNAFLDPQDHVHTEPYPLSEDDRLAIENRYRHKDGSIRWISWVAAPAAGMTYATGRDVTIEKTRQDELELAQEALRQAQKMEAMGQLTGGVAHDFNNLLTPIVGALDMLQRRGVGGEREQRLIGGAVQSAERARTLVQRLLAFARRQPLQSVAVDVDQLVRGMADLVDSTTGPQIRVVVEIAPDLPPAKADPNQLEMALLNLAVNARDAMPDGGTLRISATAEEVEADPAAGLRAGRYIRLSVADSGVGMDEATLTRAVEPFFSTKGVGKGTGLGLSMVHGLASQLGGALKISSRRALGSNIELWLPLSETAPEPSPAKDAAVKVEARGVVLLVDDEEAVRLSTADMLYDLGFEVIEADSAEAALRIIEAGTPLDLLLTDHLMPGMTGTDLAHAVRTLRPGAPILIVSGYAEVDGIEPDLPRLTKPFRKDELAASLVVVAQRREI